jgi:hypothetical protein
MSEDTVRAVIAVLREQQESELLVHARVLLHALDSGILSYKADVPESAYVAHLREAVARAEMHKSAAFPR